MTVALSTEELVEKFKNLNGQREELLVKRARVQAQIDHAREEKARLEKEMADMGTSPEKIADDELLARQELQQIVGKYQEALNALEQQLSEADKLFNEVSNGT